MPPPLMMVRAVPIGSSPFVTCVFCSPVLAAGHALVLLTPVAPCSFWSQLPRTPCWNPWPFLTPVWLRVPPGSGRTAPGTAPFYGEYVSPLSLPFAELLRPPSVLSWWVVKGKVFLFFFSPPLFFLSPFPRNRRSSLFSRPFLSSPAVMFLV